MAARGNGSTFETIFLAHFSTKWHIVSLVTSWNRLTQKRINLWTNQVRRGRLKRSGRWIDRINKNKKLRDEWCKLAKKTSATTDYYVIADLLVPRTRAAQSKSLQNVKIQMLLYNIDILYITIVFDWIWMNGILTFFAVCGRGAVADIWLLRNCYLALP